MAYGHNKIKNLSSLIIKRTKKKKKIYDVRKTQFCKKIFKLLFIIFFKF